MGGFWTYESEVSPLVTDVSVQCAGDGAGHPKAYCFLGLKTRLELKSLRTQPSPGALSLTEQGGVHSRGAASADGAVRSHQGADGGGAERAAAHGVRLALECSFRLPSWIVWARSFEVLSLD